MSFQEEVNMGEEIKVKGASLYPLSKVIRWTTGNGGLIWNRPDSVLVKTDSGEEHILPVRDITREAQLMVLAAGAMASLFLWLIFKDR